MGFNFGGGSSGQQLSQSGPVSIDDRMNTYNAAMNPTYMRQGFMNQGQPTETTGLNLGESVPQTSDFKTLANGDYNRFEQMSTASRMAPINAAWAIRGGEGGEIDQEMAKRGIFKSGAGIAAKNKEWRTSVLPASIQAGADAATQRYGQQATDLTNQWNAQWRRPEFLAAMFNGTNAQVSTGTGNNSTGSSYGGKLW